MNANPDQTMQNMIHRRDLLDPADFVGQISWSRQAPSEALAAQRVFYVDVGNARYFPTALQGK